MTTPTMTTPKADTARSAPDRAGMAWALTIRPPVSREQLVVIDAEACGAIGRMAPVLRLRDARPRWRGLPAAADRPSWIRTAVVRGPRGVRRVRHRPVATARPPASTIELDAGFGYPCFPEARRDAGRCTSERPASPRIGPPVPAPARPAARFARRHANRPRSFDPARAIFLPPSFRSSPAAGMSCVDARRRA